MVKNAQLGKELLVTITNKIGILANISKLVADHGINVEGVAGYAQGNEAKIMIVVEDVVRAKEAIAKAGFKGIKEKEILIVDLINKPGALKSITAKLAEEKIDILYAYGTACPEGCPARLILSTSDNEKALVSIKK